MFKLDSRLRGHQMAALGNTSKEQSPIPCGERGNVRSASAGGDTGLSDSGRIALLVRSFE
jgi:hypothetical protein